MKPGDRVRMTESYKTAMRGTCKHRTDEVETCFKCSSDHIDEFGDSIGVIEGLLDYNNKGETHDPSKVGPEFNVRWLPNNLRYGYHPDDLELVP